MKAQFCRANNVTTDNSCYVKDNCKCKLKLRKKEQRKFYLGGKKSKQEVNSIFWTERLRHTSNREGNELRIYWCPLSQRRLKAGGGTPLYLSHVSFQMRAGPKVQTFWWRLQQLDIVELQYKLLGEKRGDFWHLLVQLMIVVRCMDRHNLEWKMLCRTGD